MYQYVFWKDVQDVLSRKKEEQESSFYTAFIEAFQERKQESEELCYPDFSKWNCTDTDTLFHLYCQLPVTTANVGTAPIQHRINKKLYTQVFARSDFNFSPCIRFETSFCNNDSFTLIYVLSGRARLTIGEETFQLNGGCLSMIAPNVNYQFYGCEDCVALYLLVWKKRFTDIFRKVLNHKNILTEYYAKFMEGQAGPLLHFRFSEPIQTYPLIRNMLAEYYSGSEYSSDLCTSLMEYFLILAVRDTTQPNETPEPVRKNGVQILSVLQYIHENHTDLTLEQLGAQFGYNSGYLSRQLKFCVGKSFQTLLTEARICEAKYLLRYSSLSVEEIAFQVGYSSLASFSRRFSLDMAISPTQYRLKEYD